MGDFELVTAADVRLMQGLAQRVTAVRPALVNADASFGLYYGAGFRPISRDMPQIKPAV